MFDYQFHSRPIFLLTDFGTADTYVGIVKAVILGIAPHASIVDLTHEIPPQDVRAGAFALLTAVPYLPKDAVVLAVVDPGVGTDRRPIAAQVEGRTFVGPDNGLFSWVGIDPVAAKIVVLDRPQFWLPTVSSTFHGRDVFGPVAAHLSNHERLKWLGTPTDRLVTIPFPAPQIERDASDQIQTVTGEIVHVDRYGNLISNIRAADLPANPWVAVGNERMSGISQNYQTAGQASLIALIGSVGLLEIAVPNGNAAAYLNVSVGASIAVKAVPRRRLRSPAHDPEPEC
jgi:S-adenosyl-L-methionine hydrolase (adenosine-forming)